MKVVNWRGFSAEPSSGEDVEVIPDDANVILIYCTQI